MFDLCFVETEYCGVTLLKYADDDVEEYKKHFESCLRNKHNGKGSAFCMLSECILTVGRRAYGCDSLKLGAISTRV